MGIGSIFSGIPGVNPFGTDDKPPPIDYREHGKIVVPPKLDLPPPGEVVNGDSGGDWPVNQEGHRKKAQKDAAKQVIAGQGDARLRYTHPFPSNEPVTVRASDSDRIPTLQVAPMASANPDQLLLLTDPMLGSHQSIELGRNGQQVDCVRSGAGPGMADRSAKGVSRPGRGDRTGHELTLRALSKEDLDDCRRIAAWRWEQNPLFCVRESPQVGSAV